MLKFPAEVHSVKTLSDGGLGLLLHTQELGKEDMAELMGLVRKFGWVVIAGEAEKLDEKDIPAEALEFPTSKSQGQRLRGVLYRLWEKNNGGYQDFELYYKIKTEKIINWIKEKID
jgi:hypothetical protein